uniref:Uncharacterized protein n=1 Tax=Parastrongyloides trichosuri TaxID=131310 RepID=A0A0N4ZBK1_PARTI
MIGIMNVPCESPAEYYAAPKKDFSSPSSLENNSNIPTLNEQKNNILKSKSTISIEEPQMNLFVKKNKNKRIQYLADGRKIQTGETNKKPSSPKLWEQLLMRTIVHKIEDEIASPVDQIKNVASEFDNLNNGLLKKDNPISQSTYSLVSDNRIRSQCSKCRPFKFFCKRQLSKSSTSLASCESSSR